VNVIVAEPGGELADLAPAPIQELFRRDGLVVFRGFQPTPARFEALTKPFTRDYFFGYGRAPFAGFPAITNVNESQLALEPHCDNGIRPEAVRPEITWFWCERPAVRDGETTFFDGLVVWERLSEASRALFRSTPIVFRSRVAPAAWRALGHATVESFLAFLPSIGARAGSIDATQTVEVDVVTNAVRTPRWADGLAFVSSLLVAGSPSFEAMQVFLEDGRPVPAEAIADLRAVLASCIETIAWQPGDIGMLDNTRFLHGRRGFSDPARRIYLIQTLHAAF
jgi:alpha-ketoglutarate-dependent taurine dioxygenase